MIHFIFDIIIVRREFETKFLWFKGIHNILNMLHCFCYITISLNMNVDYYSFYSLSNFDTIAFKSFYKLRHHIFILDVKIFYL